MSHAQAQPDLRDLLASAAETLVARLVPDPDRQAQYLGGAFLACEEAAQGQPEALQEALRRDALESFLLPHVRASLSDDAGSSPRGGWLGTYVGADGRSIEDSEEDFTDRDALDLSRRAMARALSIARQQGNQTLLRNLRWYQERLSHKSYEAIARADQKVPATVRTGVARARKFLLKVVHELQHAQPAPLDGEAPEEIESLRELWVQQELEVLEQGLEQTRAAYAEDPHWLNLAALLAADRGRHDEAEQLYERALLVADAPGVRGRVLNNLGNLRDDQGDLESAERYWLRSRRLVPAAPTPLLNLLASASLRRDYASAQHYVAEISDLLNTGRLTREERSYIARRLQENPRFAWLRDTDVWRLGPARWIRASRRSARAISRILTLTASLLLAGLTLLYPGSASSGVTREATAPAPVRVELARWETASTPARGGDSMGKPRKRSPGRPALELERLLAGDSMGRDPCPPPRPGSGQG